MRIQFEEWKKELENLENRIQSIAFANEEMYDYFKNEIDKIKQDMFNKGNDLGGASELYKKIVLLDIEISNYWNGRKNKPELVFQEKDEDSGNKDLKIYRINLYKNIFELMKKSGKIDIKQVEDVKAKWLQDKNEGLEYTLAEMNMVEESLADIFLAYQLQYIRENKNMPNIEAKEFCDDYFYKSKFKEKFIETVRGMEKGNYQKTKLEYLFVTTSIGELIENREIWEAISGVTIQRTNNEQTKTVENVVEEKSEQKEDVALIPKYRKAPKGKLLIRIRKFGFLGREIERDVFIKLDKNGSVVIPKKYNIIYASIPEGIEDIAERNAVYQKNTCFGLDYHYKLKYIDLPESLERIGDWAFKECESLEEINSYGELKSIGESAFWDCKNLKRVNAEKSQLYYIGERAFLKSGIEEMKLPNNRNLDILIKEEAFLGTKLSSINLDAVKKIGKRAFYGCEGLKIVNAENSNLELIGAESFIGSGIEEIILPNRDNLYITICARAFRKTPLASINLQSAGEIYNEAFENCDKLGTNQKITIGERAMIYDQAFKDTGITELEIQGVLYTIVPKAFKGSDNLKRLYIRKDAYNEERCEEIFDDSNFEKHVNIVFTDKEQKKEDKVERKESTLKRKSPDNPDWNGDR